MKPAILFVTLLLVTAVVVSAHPPTGIVVDKAGTIYFTDLETVWKFQNGHLSVLRPGVRGRHVHELNIDGAGNVYGADISYQPATKKFIAAVWKISHEGKLTYLLEPTDDPLRGPSVWFDQHHNTYQVDQNNHLKQRTVLLRRTASGDLTALAGGEYGHSDGKGPEARFGSVSGMFVTHAGAVYLGDGNSVRKIEHDGTVTTIARQLDFTSREDDPRLFASYGGLAGLAVDDVGNVFVADSGKRRLLKVEARLCFGRSQN